MNPEPGEPERGGPPEGAVQRLASRVIQWVATRLELFALEFQEERRSAILLLVLLAGGGVLFLLAFVFLTLAAILALDPAWRPLGALVAALLDAAAATFILLRARRLLRDRPPPFAATLGELQRDREWLKNLK